MLKPPLPIKRMIVFGNDIHTGDFVSYIVRACDSFECINPASIVLSWDESDMHCCVSCARRLIEVGRVMGHYQPEKTARLMTRDEMLVDDVGLSVDTLKRIDHSLTLRQVLWGESATNSEQE